MTSLFPGYNPPVAGQPAAPQYRLDPSRLADFSGAGQSASPASFASFFPGDQPPGGPANWGAAADLPRIRAILQGMQGGGIGNAGIPGGPQLVAPMRSNPMSSMIMGTRGPDGNVMRGYQPDAPSQVTPMPVAHQVTPMPKPMPTDMNWDSGRPTTGYLPPGSMPMTTGRPTQPLDYPIDTMARPVAQLAPPVEDPRLAQFSPGMRARLKPFFLGR